jgi:hypothetical protein
MDFCLEVLEFSRNVFDECLYVRIQGGIIAIIALYVDDLLIDLHVTTLGF